MDCLRLERLGPYRGLHTTVPGIVGLPSAPRVRQGGWGPRWRDDGRELFFAGLDGTMMAAMVDPVNDASHPPQALFAAGIVQGSYLHQFAVTGDGKRFLLRV